MKCDELLTWKRRPRRFIDRLFRGWNLQPCFSCVGFSPCMPD